MLRELYLKYINNADNKIKHFKNYLNRDCLRKHEIMDALQEIEDWERIKAFYEKELKNLG